MRQVKDRGCCSTTASFALVKSAPLLARRSLQSPNWPGSVDAVVSKHFAVPHPCSKPPSPRRIRFCAASTCAWHCLFEDIVRGAGGGGAAGRAPDIKSCNRGTSRSGARIGPAQAHGPKPKSAGHAASPPRAAGTSAWFAARSRLW